MSKKNNFTKILIRFFPYILLLVLTYFVVSPLYHFGDNNHIEQLPFVLAHSDPTYLKNDFFVSYARRIGPRYYYASLLSAIIKVIPLEQTFYLLTFLSHLCIYILTYLLVKLLIKDKYLPFFIILVIARFQYSNLGDAGNINDNYLTPQLLAMPFILGALLASIRGRYILSWVFTLLALPIQPSLALLTSVPIAGNLFFNYRISKRYILIPLYLLSLIGTAYILFIRFTNVHVLSDKLYIYILAYFRHPHHYIPSTFLAKDYFMFVMEVLLIYLSLVYLFREKKNVNVLKSIASMSIISLFLLFVGYFFVEIIPIKSIVELQIFRIVFLIRWLFIVSAMVMTFKIINKTINYKITITAGLLLSLPLIFFSFTKGVHLAPEISITYEPERTSLYAFVSSSTAPDSVFLTPPEFGSMRTVPKRAIVVDWKSFPFNEKFTYEWYQRIHEIYGQGNLDSNYHAISDKKISYLKNKYAFEYAILYTKTNTQFRSIYDDGVYKIVIP